METVRSNIEIDATLRTTVLVVDVGDGWVKLQVEGKLYKVRRGDAFKIDLVTAVLNTECHGKCGNDD